MMIRLLALLAVISILTGCSESSVNSDKALKAAAETGLTDEKQASPDMFIPNPQVSDDRTLTNVGDVTTDRKGELTLKAFKELNQSFTIGGIQYTIKNVKLLHFVPDYSLIDFYHTYTHEEEFDFIKVGVELKNNSQENYHFAPIAVMNINGFMQKNWEDDFYLEELNGELMAGQLKRGNLGFIVDELVTLDQIEILTGDLVGQDKKVKSEPINISINIE